MSRIYVVPFRVLVADPPWLFGDQLPGGGRGAAKHYPTMTVDQIARFPLPRMLNDSWLFLWRVHTHQDEARFVMRAWGFEYASELVWEKLTSKRGLPHVGMGRTLRMGHEICLIGRRGRPDRISKSIRSSFAAKVGEHSEKPEEFYQIVERFSRGPYVELFARRERDRWTTFGNALGRPHP